MWLLVNSSINKVDWQSDGLELEPYLVVKKLKLACVPQILIEGFEGLNVSNIY